MTISLTFMCGLALAGETPCLAASLFAQAATQAAPQAVRIVGTVTAIDGKALTIKSDAGATTTVDATDATRVLRAEPGAKSLSEASPAQLSDIALGDRVLVAATPADGGNPGKALTVVAMKRGDIAQRQKEEQADWQRRGIGGLVKSVDPAASTITIAAGPRTIVIHTTPQTVFRRYDPASIKFSDAKPSSMDQIHPGDQLRARGNRSTDGSELTADEVVAGSFRNIAGIVNSVDEASNTITVTDLATKKPVVIHITPDSQMHKLPETMAQGIAVRLKNPNAAGQTSGGQTSGAGATNPASASGSQGGGQSQAGAWRQGTGAPGSGAPGNWAPGSGATGAGAGGQRSGDLSQMLQRAPAVQLSDLHKGDAVMIVATEGTPEAATAVTLVAGVEPILTAPASASQSMFSASWNLGGGAAESAGTP